MNLKNGCTVHASHHMRYKALRFISVPDVQSTYSNTVTIPQAFSSTYFSSSKFHCKTSAADLSAHTYNIYQNMQNYEWCVMSFGKDPQNYV